MTAPTATRNLGYMPPGIASFTAQPANATELGLMVVGTAVKMQTTQNPGLVDQAIGTGTTAVNRPVGVLFTQPTAIGDEVNVVTSGVCKALAGGTLTVGMALQATAAGKLIDAPYATTGTYLIMGYALQNAASGEMFTMLVAPSVIKTA